MGSRRGVYHQHDQDTSARHPAGRANHWKRKAWPGHDGHFGKIQKAGARDSVLKANKETV